MANRIGDGHKHFVWKMPDRQPEPGEGYISIYLPHPFMHLPSADDILAPVIMRKLPAWILSPRNAGKRWPFDVSIIRPNMPPEIRDRMFKKIIEDALNERLKPRPAIKAPPKGDGKARNTKSSEFVGIARVDRPAKKAPGHCTTPHAHSVNTTLGTNNFSAALAAHASAMTFVRR
jgi:hypothetical protein